MLFFINFVMGLVLFPLALVFGKPVRMRLARAYLPAEVSSVFPLAGLTPVFEFVAWGWYLRALKKHRIAGTAFLCWMFTHDTTDDTTRFHEALHIVQQSMFAPLLVGLVYLLDLLMYAPFQRWFKPRSVIRISTVEKVVYTVTGQDTQLRAESTTKGQTS